MNLIVYAPSIEICEKIIRLDMEKLTSKLGLELHRSLETLKMRLSHPLNEIAIAVLYVVSEKELAELLQIKSLLWEIPIILIMTLADKVAIKKAHLLRPRFLANDKSDFNDIITVINRIIQKNKIFTSNIQEAEELKYKQTGGKVGNNGRDNSNN